MQGQSFWRGVFSEGDASPSFARVACVPTILIACWSIGFLVFKNHTAPDALTLGALAVFAVSPYGTNKIVAALGAVKASVPGGTS
jgi:hypothetical protein